jgi:hypothetical protein
MNARPNMADRWIHDRPFRAPTRKKPARAVQEQPRLELPVPMPVAKPEAETEAATEPQRGVSLIDFYV